MNTPPTVDKLLYKPSLREVQSRLKLFYTRQAGDRIFATMGVPSRAIAKFAESYPHGPCQWPDLADRVRFWDELYQEQAALEDDSIPAAYLSELDQGLYGGLVGGEVRFMADPNTGWISSMCPPLLADWSEFDRLRLDLPNAWWERYCRLMETFVTGCRGRWVIGHFILIDALNFVFELLGATQTYLSLDEHPELVRRAIDFAYDLNVRVQEQFFQTVPSLDGGTFSSFSQWLPGRVVSESLDPYHMTSVAYFEQWGREPAERIMTHFDGGVIHIHGNGRHLLEASSTLRGLKAMLLADDRGFPLAFDIIAALKARVGDVPISVNAPYEAFADRLRRRDLPGGVLYHVQKVPTIDAANRLMEEVRAYRL
jgi:hypothetical protein